MFWNKASKTAQEAESARIELAAALSFKQCQQDSKLAKLYFEHKRNDQDATESFLNWQERALQYSIGDTIQIADEQENVLTYLKLWSIFSSEDVHVKIDFQIADSDSKVHPFVFLPLIQNALHNGYNSMSEHPVKIKISAIGGSIKLEVSNRVNHYLSSQAENDYIQHFQDRLKLQYPTHNLFLNSNSNLFKAVLLINN
ncbi:hypothetical protein GQF61_15345 [Sphingobacterium sp. DK4209]|uniref:Signal transduction histidine kinase internal region domain-containing protein n=1 Tax=Sphingobacterium zhuxiongii TaxID=2662364 RepID=A0A5Q0Q9G7_9SPHI|nr:MULTISPECIES: hypothetical protein [unclassified Sphingobacterium]MVZ67234.1 hypothetical protein [Sphingobacterium sp. DK4209]QGA26737.1 hypothetical protein GFH32_10555 [Sphingobacterium sp. dk4302]